jgi:hypothetical protein
LCLFTFECLLEASCDPSCFTSCEVARMLFMTVRTFGGPFSFSGSRNGFPWICYIFEWDCKFELYDRNVDIFRTEMNFSVQYSLLSGLWSRRVLLDPLCYVYVVMTWRVKNR